MMRSYAKRASGAIIGKLFLSPASPTEGGSFWSSAARPGFKERVKVVQTGQVLHQRFPRTSLEHASEVYANPARD